jgi:hypothetical protein
VVNQTVSKLRGDMIVTDEDQSRPYPEALGQYTESITLNPNDAKV